MASVTTNWFEIERRNIMFKPTTTMPEGSALGYNGDPNLVINGNTDGETLLYNSPIATMYAQSDGIIWYKQQLPNVWLQIRSGSSDTCCILVEKVVSGNDEEIFYTLDLSTYQGFDWTIEASYLTRHSIRKVMASYNEGILDNNEFGILGYYFDIEISIYKDGSNCIFKIINNESYDINCKVKFYS